MSNLQRPDQDTSSVPALSPDTAEQSRIQSLRLVTISVGVLTGLAAAGLFALYLSQPIYQFAILALVFLVNSLFSIFTVRVLFPRGRIFTGVLIGTLLFGLVTAATSAFLSGLGLPIAIVILIYGLLISSLLSKNWQANLITFFGLLAAGACALLTEYSPAEHISVTLIDVLTPAILGILFMVYVVLLAMQFVTATLRVRLVTTFLTIVLIPLAVLSLIQSGFMFNVLTSEVNRSLQLAAQQTAMGVDRFMNESQRSVQEAAQLEVFRRYLSLDELHRAGSVEEQDMRLTLRVLETNELNSTIYISSYALLNMKGIAVYDTLSERIASRFSPDTLRAMGIDIDSIMQGEGIDEFNQLYFQVPAWTGNTFVSDLQVTSSTRSFLYISAPVRAADGTILGVLRARYDGLLLQDLLESYNGLLGGSSYAVLLDENNIRLADAYTPNFLYKSVAPLPEDQVKLLKINNRLPDLPSDMLSTSFSEFNTVLNNYDTSNPIFRANLSPSTVENQLSQIGAIFGIKSRPWKVVYLRTDFSEEELRRDQRRLTLVVTTVIVVLVGFVAVVISQFLSYPIIRLTHTAQRISSGDLEAQAPAQSADEYGMLGAAFNSMTTQLRTLISQLEDRVRARTRDIEDRNAALSNRARQLQTVSDVARQIVSAQELETLLGSVTHLISERFGFYHVGVFLLDEKREYAVLRAANSAGGQRMLARSHRLPVGKVGIVGFTTGTGQARIATDVGEDAVYFNNPALPETRSEMALPLSVGGQTIGALDIQSMRSNDFSENDIELFTTLADQVAIAIHNNRLYMQTLRALDEAQALHRQYL
jgi:HAMP domain-containing protein